MDELTRVREWRADCPGPGHVRLAAGRRRLLEETARGGRTRRLRADWRFRAAAVVAAVTAIAVLVVVLGGSTQRNLGPPTEPVPGATVTEVLQKAAATVARHPVPRPHAGQWVYRKSLVDDRIDGGGPKPQEYWFKYADPSLERTKGGDDYSERETFRFLAALPDDPRQVLERVRRFYPEPGAGTADHEYHALGELLKAYPTHPRGQARLYRALATVPGIRMKDHLERDVAGHPAVVVYRRGSGTEMERNELLIDPRTFAYLGERHLSPDDWHDSNGHHWHKGEMITDIAVLRWAVVDADGDRP